MLEGVACTPLLGKGFERDSHPASAPCLMKKHGVCSSTLDVALDLGLTPDPLLLARTVTVCACHCNRFRKKMFW
jgi:hypothetical protein